MSQRIADTLEQARDLMKNGHWTKGRNYDKGSYCMLGALRMAATGDPYGASLVSLKAIDHVRKYITPYYVSYFNDTHTWEEVDALLARAAEAARQP